MIQPVRKLQPPRGKAKGVWEGGRRKISVAFEERDFERINQRAANANVTFSEMARRLCLKALGETGP